LTPTGAIKVDYRAKGDHRMLTVNDNAWACRGDGARIPAPAWRWRAS